ECRAHLELRSDRRLAASEPSRHTKAEQARRRKRCDVLVGDSSLGIRGRRVARQQRLKRDGSCYKIRGRYRFGDLAAHLLSHRTSVLCRFSSRSRPWRVVSLTFSARLPARKGRIHCGVIGFDFLWIDGKRRADQEQISNKPSSRFS